MVVRIEIFVQFSLNFVISLWNPSSRKCAFLEDSSPSAKWYRLSATAPILHEQSAAARWNKKLLSFSRAHFPFFPPRGILSSNNSLESANQGIIIIFHGASKWNQSTVEGGRGVATPRGERDEILRVDGSGRGWEVKLKHLVQVAGSGLVVVFTKGHTFDRTAAKWRDNTGRKRPFCWHFFFFFLCFMVDRWNGVLAPLLSGFWWNNVWVDVLWLF